MEIRLLGTGTSTGVPLLRCKCPVCHSNDSRDKRLRQSAIVHHNGKTILIDCGPDFRTQMLRSGETDIDALLITHIHYDHVGGLDDLRPFAFGQTPLPIYGPADVLEALKRHQLRYCFGENAYPGAPRFELHAVEDGKLFDCQGIEVMPIEVMHNIPILGYRIGDMAYITDCKSISDLEIEKLHGVPLLIINALRIKPHPTHMSLDESLNVISRIEPRQAVLIHMSHDIGFHADVASRLPSNVTLGHDNLSLTI